MIQCYFQVHYGLLYKMISHENFCFLFSGFLGFCFVLNLDTLSALGQAEILQAEILHLHVLMS